MKKNLLALAVISAVGATGVAQANMSVNPDGTGQVLLYPYYTTQAGYNTNVHVVNTTDKVKAVKVRFLEGKNSQEVLDFNLYLSPFDEWTGAILRTADGAKLVTTDTSCTVPKLPTAGVNFRNFQYVGDSDNSLARTREGYLEVIEMGVLSNPSLAGAATHINGTPAACGQLVSAWNPGGAFQTGNVLLDLPTGGLYGYSSAVNVESGMVSTYPAKAIDGFADTELHSAPGSTLPSLNSGVLVADVFNNGTVVTTTFTNAVDAVSQLFMHNSIANDYVTDASINASTDWVINFPTKRFYVNGSLRAPFVNAWSKSNSKSCQPIGLTYFDREEGTAQTELDFSPTPPGETASLCYEVNVLTFNGTSVFGSENLKYNVNLAPGFTQGWAQMNFSDAGYVLPPSTFTGLPVIGFASIAFQNGNVGGLLSNYSGAVEHKATRTK